ncbi:MAG: hypothetical protein Q9167_007177 [Letrouitia subvulpina]
MMRLYNSEAIFVAYSYNINTRTTTGIIVRTDEAETMAIKDSILYYKELAGQKLLLRAIITEIGLKANREHLLDVKQDVMDIEHSTGQHTWGNYIARDEKPKADAELSRMVHGLRIQIALINRMVEVGLIWVELLLESLTQDKEKSTGKKQMLEWIQNLKIQIKMTQLDVEMVAKRAENQVGAVRNVHHFWPLFSTSESLSKVA